MKQLHCFKEKFQIERIVLGIAGVISLTNSPLLAKEKEEKAELPNILWIVSEDNSAFFTGCYGNSFATTPNIDRQAARGFLYTHAYSPNAVSSHSRNTIITGAYSASNGNENMRSNYPKSEEVRTYPEYLRQKDITAPSALSWEKAFMEGKTDERRGRYFRTKPVEELYDTENDPWEVYNLADNPGSVAALAAEALYGLGEKEAAIKAYITVLQDTVTYRMKDRNFALNSIDAIDAKDPEIIAAVRRLYSVPSL